MGPLTMNVKERLPELSQLEPTVKEFDTVIVEGRQLQGIQDTHRKQLRETNQRSKDLGAAGAASATSWSPASRASTGSKTTSCWASASSRACRKRNRLTTGGKGGKERLEALEKAAAKAATRRSDVRVGSPGGEALSPPGFFSATRRPP